MTHRQFTAKYQGEPPYKHTCDCGQPGLYRFNGWECERCHRLRLEQSRELSVRGVVAARPVGLAYGKGER
jgi:hypothetical protein